MQTKTLNVILARLEEKVNIFITKLYYKFQKIIYHKYLYITLG